MNKYLENIWLIGLGIRNWRREAMKEAKAQGSRTMISTSNNSSSSRRIRGITEQVQYLENIGWGTCIAGCINWFAR